VTLVGYADQGSAPRVDVTYSDGTLDQSQTVTLTGSHTNVVLKYMPWLTVSGESGATELGDTRHVTFDVHQSGSAHLAAAGSKSTPRVKISIKPPAGWTARRCKKASKLAGTTSARSGKLTLTICASVSGEYTVKSHGAVPTRQLMLRVKGAPATAPQSVSVRSPKPAQAQVSWAAPVYSGGARITEYRLTAALKGRRTKTAVIKSKHFTAKSLVHTFTGLTRAKTWAFRVYAITRHGTSQAATATVRVA
jgi:hypothetical protein